MPTEKCGTTGIEAAGEPLESGITEKKFLLREVAYGYGSENIATVLRSDVVKDNLSEKGVVSNMFHVGRDKVDSRNSGSF